MQTDRIVLLQLEINFLINDNYPLITLCNWEGFLSLFFESNYYFVRNIKGHNNAIL